MAATIAEARREALRVIAALGNSRGLIVQWVREEEERRVVAFLNSAAQTYWPAVVLRVYAEQGKRPRSIIGSMEFVKRGAPRNTARPLSKANKDVMVIVGGNPVVHFVTGKEFPCVLSCKLFVKEFSRRVAEL